MNLALQPSPYLKTFFISLGTFFVSSLAGQSLLENTQVRFFTDAGFTSVRDSSEQLTSEFLFGGIEILLTSQIADKISLLAEPVLKPDGTLSMERVMVKYSFANYLNLSAGRLYTPIGLWNTTFFRYAKALTPTIDSPLIIANFEEGGTAINKDNGIQISGDDISSLRVGYRFMVGNGYNVSNSNHKMIFTNIFIEPVDNLRFAIYSIHQKIRSTSFFPDGRLDAIGISVMYMQNKNFEFASEFHRANYRLDVASKSTNIYYAYAGYKLKKLTPYLQYYNGVINFTTDYSNATVGFRYNLSALSLLKAEALLLESDDFSKINQVKILWAIGF